jgi:5-methylcytosine-specific restriction endonuclease McrA
MKKSIKCLNCDKRFIPMKSNHVCCSAQCSQRHQKNKLKFKKTEFIYEILKNASCRACGIRDIEVLEFDHINPKTKIDNISNMMIKRVYKVEDVLREVKKCQILCANCHRKKTHKERKIKRFSILKLLEKKF